jgi:hypothetical protein
MLADDRLLARLRQADPVAGAEPVTPPPDLLRAIVVSPVRRPRSLLLVASPALAVVVIAVFVVSALLRPPSVFASWTAAPTPLDPAFAAVMQRNCVTQPYDPRLDADLRATLDEQAALFADVPLVVMHQRGRAAIALFARPRADGEGVLAAMCMTIADEPGGAPIAGGGSWGDRHVERPANGPVRLFLTGRNSSEAGTFTAYAGRVDADVRQVTVERSAGEAVIATVSNGYFLAWWPDDALATRVAAYGHGGVVLTQLDADALGTPALPACETAGQACGGGG